MTTSQADYMRKLRVVGYWTALYLIAIGVVLMDCIVWRP